MYRSVFDTQTSTTTDCSTNDCVARLTETALDTAIFNTQNKTCTANFDQQHILPTHITTCPFTASQCCMDSTGTPTGQVCNINQGCLYRNDVYFCTTCTDNQCGGKGTCSMSVEGACVCDGGYDPSGNCSRCLTQPPGRDINKNCEFYIGNLQVTVTNDVSTKMTLMNNSNPTYLNRLGFGDWNFTSEILKFTKIIFRYSPGSLEAFTRFNLFYPCSINRDIGYIGHHDSDNPYNRQYPNSNGTTTEDIVFNIKDLSDIFKQIFTNPLGPQPFNCCSINMLVFWGSVGGRAGESTIVNIYLV